MTFRPAVSIIMPFLNAEPYMEEAIQSVIDQTYAAWELLLIDDGSSDASSRIARDHANRNPDQIRYFDHEGHANHGGSYSRNVGVRHARGDYITFLDADDIFLPGKLERQISVLEKQSDVGALYGATLYWNSWSEAQANTSDGDRLAYPDVPTERVYPPPALIKLIYVEKTAAVPCLCSLIVRRDVLDRTGAFELRFRSLYQDQALYTKVFAETPVYVMSDCLEKYRQHEDSRCHVAKRTGERQRVELDFLSWQAEYLSRRDDVPIEFSRAIRMQYRHMRYPLLASFARLRRRSLGRVFKSSV